MAASLSPKIAWQFLQTISIHLFASNFEACPRKREEKLLEAEVPTYNCVHLEPRFFLQARCRKYLLHRALVLKKSKSSLKSPFANSLPRLKTILHNNKSHLDLILKRISFEFVASRVSSPMVKDMVLTAAITLIENRKITEWCVTGIRLWKTIPPLH